MKNAIHAGLRRLMTGALGALALAAGTASAAPLTVTENGDIAAGVAAFGPSSAVITWSHLFPPGTVWPSGSLTPALGGGVQTDPVTGSSVTGNLSIANYIEGIGFNSGPGGVGPELAVSGPENFTLNFAAPVSRIGLAIATGLGSFPHEFDHLGAIFTLTAGNGDTGVVSLVDLGSGFAAYVTISSATPFSSLTFFEPSGNLADQYFGDVVSGDAAVPEPPAWTLLIAGFGLAGRQLRRRLGMRGSTGLAGS